MGAAGPRFSRSWRVAGSSRLSTICCFGTKTGRGSSQIRTREGRQAQGCCGLTSVSPSNANTGIPRTWELVCFPSVRDPRIGKQTFRTTELVLSEPDPSLFKLPKRRLNEKNRSRRVFRAITNQAAKIPSVLPQNLVSLNGHPRSRMIWNDARCVIGRRSDRRCSTCVQTVARWGIEQLLQLHRLTEE